jgi:hypothetical protein
LSASAYTCVRYCRRMFLGLLTRYLYIAHPMPGDLSVPRKSPYL